MKFLKTTQILSAASLSLFLAACGGGDLSFGTVGGTVTGMNSGQSVTLQNNGGDALTVTGNTSFTFATSLVELTKFTVTVLTQPAGQTCVVTRGVGVIPNDGSTANKVTVTCSADTLGGVVTGLAPGASMTLDSGAGVQATVTQNGVFTFPGLLAAGTAYAVTVVTQPAAQTCTVANPAGTAVAGAQNLVSVNCV